MSRSIRKEIFGVTVEAHPVVFPVSAVLVVLFVIATALFPSDALVLFNGMQSFIADHFSWLYVYSMTGFLLFALFLGFGPFGNVRLGPDNIRPDFPTITWFSMLFSAGMGIGMLFFGVAEPMWHYLSPPGMEGSTPEAARKAMGLTLFHWCLHPWALYAVVGAALAYFGFRRGLPLSFRSIFYPFLGKRIHGWMGDVIDVLAVLATLFGLATSLGIGAKQVNAGLNHVFGLPQSTEMQVLLIALITAAAVASLVSGLEVGIRRLSELNMGLAGFLLVFLFIAGPTFGLLAAVFSNAGAYIAEIPAGSVWTFNYTDEKEGWFHSWTILYWAWWIAWSPFVGMFIARVSKGRTMREFILGVLLVPSGVAIIWMTGFGSTAISQEVEASQETTTAENSLAVHTFNIQEIDPETGLPFAAQGDWLVAADAQGIANPDYVKVKPLPGGSEDEQTLFVTADGKTVLYNQGVLVDSETAETYSPSEEATFDGAFAATSTELSLGGYLNGRVLTDGDTTKADTTATVMFVMLEAYPLTILTALIGTLSVILFFITSSDSASMVADIIASGGNQDPTTGTRIFWGVLEGTLAAVLLLAGGLQALQTGSITIGLPFCILVIGMCVSLAVGLYRERAGKIPKAQLDYAAGRSTERMSLDQ